MKPSNFEYVRATTVQDAVESLARYGERAKLLAGGQTLIPLMNFRLAAPEVLIDIGRIDELDFIRLDGNTLVIGAGTRHNTVLSSHLVRDACPLLTEAYSNVSHHSVRNRGTIGGNVCHNDPASEVPLILTLLGATLILVGPGGTRSVAADDFFADLLETVVKPDEILTEIRIPKQAANEGYGFTEVSPRKGDYAIVGAGCRFTVAGGKFENVRLGFVGAGHKIKRMPAAEAALEGHPTSDATIAAATDMAAQTAEPSADVQADVEYKRDLVKSLGTRALRIARDRAT